MRVCKHTVFHSGYTNLPSYTSFYIPTRVYKGSNFSSSSPVTFVFLFFFILFFNNGHPVRYNVINGCGFDLHFPDNHWCDASFHVPIGYLYVVLGKISIKALCPVLNLVICCCFPLFILLLSYRSFFLILDIDSLSDIWSATLFFHSVNLEIFDSAPVCKFLDI